MKNVYDLIHRVAGADTTVLIGGESGTGKERVASAIHYSSARKDKPLVRVSCTALSEALLENELFGHEETASSEAPRVRLGRIEQAEGGTLFLDEIGEFTEAVQVKLLRIIQTHEYERIGSNTSRRANVRIIAATKHDLCKAVQAGRFRQDLFYRVNVFPIYLPALRDRKEDLLLLADRFVEKYARTLNKHTQRISTAAINMILAYHWPGNVRELENCIEHAVLASSDDVIHGCHLPPTLQVPGDVGDSDHCSLKTCVNILERDMIMDAIKRSHGNVNAASRQLGITPRMTRYKIQKLNIDHCKDKPEPKR